MSEHEPLHEDHDPAIYGRNARYGLVLFFIYFALYAGFIYLNAFSRETMAQTYAGVNLALWYGFGLIVSALVLAGVYMALCRK